MADGEQLARVALVGAAGVAAYQFLYKPWALRRDLEDLARQAALNAAARGSDPIAGVVAAACTAGAAAYGAPPTIAGPICQGLAPLAIKGAKEVVKGAAIAGKVVGKGIGKGAKAVGSTTKKVAKSISHGFGLWGLGDVYDLGDVDDNPFFRVSARSSGLDRTTQRARGRVDRTAEPRPRTRTPATAAAFYLRHL